MSASSRMYGSYFTTTERSSKPARTLAETPRGSAVVFDPGRMPGSSSLSLSETEYQPLEMTMDQIQLPSNWAVLYIAFLREYARVLEVVERSQYLKDLESRAVHRCASERATGCKPREPCVSSTPFHSINNSAPSFKDSGCPKAPSPVLRVAGDEVVEMEQVGEIGSKDCSGTPLKGAGEFSSHISSHSSSPPSTIRLATLSGSSSVESALRHHSIVAANTSSFAPPSVSVSAPLPAPTPSPSCACSTQVLAASSGVHTFAPSQLAGVSHAARSPSIVSLRAATNTVPLASKETSPRPAHRMDCVSDLSSVSNFFSTHTSASPPHLITPAYLHSSMLPPLVEVDRAITTAPLPSRPFGSRLSPDSLPTPISVERAAAPPAARSSHLPTRDSCHKSTLYSLVPQRTPRKRLHHPGKDPP
ncbi:hypothetical protein B0H13DRAFT_2093836 [Mycena leptocephala]|nr:hypothetical protein B0H13DRAFT_2093836 [Mycena leptocephala]